MAETLHVPENAPATADYFETPHLTSRYVICHTRGEDDRPDMVQKAWQIHAKCYTDFGYFSKEAIRSDGTLVPELDGTREREGIPLTVSYLLAIPRGKSVQEAEGSLRIIDAHAGQVVSLPTYHYFDCEETTEVRETIQRIIEQYGAQNVREIAALGTIGSGATSYELMRAIVQNAMIHEYRTGQQEVFLTALTDISLGPIVDLAGAGAAHVLGDPVEIFQDDPRAKRDLEVTPVLFEPCRVTKAIMEELIVTSDERRRVQLMRRLMFFNEGLSDAEIGETVLNFLRDNSGIDT